MSVLADKTDFKVWRILRKCLKEMDKINESKLNVTKTDDFEISLATNMQKRIIDNNK